MWVSSGFCELIGDAMQTFMHVSTRRERAHVLPRVIHEYDCSVLRLTHSTLMTMTHPRDQLPPKGWVTARQTDRHTRSLVSFCTRNLHAGHAEINPRTHFFRKPLSSMETTVGSGTFQRATTKSWLERTKSDRRSRDTPT